MRWFHTLTPPADGATNMALDEALMRRAARTKDAVVRIYGWSTATLSLGRNQRARGCYDERAARDAGVAFVRRPTGGRAVLHDHEVTYSATLPVADAAAAGGVYDFINSLLLDALGCLGVRAVRAAGGVSMPPGLRPCFDVPSDREITFEGRKLVGSAQWRHDGAVLQHGSILIRDDQPLIGRLLKEPLATMETPRAASLRDALGTEPSLEQVAATVVQALRATTGQRVERLDVEEAVLDDVARLRVTYAADTWTWRR